MHENLIKLLSEALKFYAEDANYVNGQIEKDKGHQAKFILNLVKENETQMKVLENDFEKLQEEIDPNKPENDLQELIEQITKLKNDVRG